MLQRLEFYRDSLALVPAPGDKHPGVAYFLEIGPSGPQRRICDCSTTKNQTCPHILELAQAYKHLSKQLNGQGFFEPFKKSVWYKLAALLSDIQADSNLSISRQKVVVYSQYLNMIRIIGQYLGTLKIGHVVLTGQSRERGAIVSRFSDDPDCRVFVGSLKAGGVGIDLVAASVVIHYDRWWNAAREDQATDRVHRIGQNWGVQVFKLVTEGTLEEKIAAIIGRKKKLADSILQEDDPGQLKTFTREELIDLLSFASS